VGELWERQERHLVTVTGPAVADAVDAITALHQALSDYRQIAADHPQAEVPPGAVTIAAVGGRLVVRIEYVETPDMPTVEEVDGRG
jgi:hypothetical protein